MKTSHLLSGLVLITAVAASGCEYADFQTIAASPQASQSSVADVSADAPTPAVTEGEDVVLPSGDAPAGGTTGGGTVEETEDAPVVEVCVPETDSEFCARLAKDCDSVTDVDNCGAARTTDCGTCGPGFACGKGGTPNVCASVTGPDCYTYDFVSTRDGYENIYSTSTCSKEAPIQLTKKTDGGAHFRNLQISADGKKVSYDYIYPGVSEWTMSIDDLATLGVGGLNISGCRSAALNATNDQAVYVCATGLYIVDLQDINGGRMVASDEQDGRLFEKAVWSPVTTATDASYNHVVFSARETNDSDNFYVFNATSIKPRPLYAQYNGRDNVILQGTSADISTDGEKMTFVRKDEFSGDKQIWTCDLMFDQPVVSENALSPSFSHVPTKTKESLCLNPQLLTSEGNNNAPHWTSNGKHIFFTSDRDGNNEIYVMKAGGSEQSNVTQNPASDRDSDTFTLRRIIDPSAVDENNLATKAGL